MEFATETGLVGISLLTFVVIYSLTQALIAQYRRRDPLMRGISFTVIMVLIAMMIHSTVEFNLQIPAIAGTFMLILAMAWLSLHLKEDGAQTSV